MHFIFKIHKSFHGIFVTRFVRGIKLFFSLCSNFCCAIFHGFLAIQAACVCVSVRGFLLVYFLVWEVEWLLLLLLWLLFHMVKSQLASESLRQQICNAFYYILLLFFISLLLSLFLLLFLFTLLAIPEVFSM